jgi:hypothetical protein
MASVLRQSLPTRKPATKTVSIKAMPVPENGRKAIETCPSGGQTMRANSSVLICVIFRI